MWILLTKPVQKYVTKVCLHCSFARLKNKHIGVLGTNVATISWLHWSPVSGYNVYISVRFIFGLFYNQGTFSLRTWMWSIKNINGIVHKWYCTGDQCSHNMLAALVPSVWVQCIHFSKVYLQVVLQSGYIFAEDLNVINKKHLMELFINGFVPSS